MTCLSEQTALLETANAALKSENEGLRGKLSLAAADNDRLSADNALMRLRIESMIHESSKLRTVVISAGNLLVEGMKADTALRAEPSSTAITAQTEVTG